IVIGATIGGFFYWRENVRLTPPEEWSMAEYSKPSDFTVTETAKQKIIENKSAGLIFAIPKDWIASSTQYSLKLSSPEAKEKNGVFMEKGCRIITEIVEINTNLSILENELKTGVWGKHITQQDRTVINNKDALSYIARSETLGFYHAGIMISYQGKVYSVILNTIPKDSDICLQDFENIKNSIKIQ
ncbi:hypothetical protein COT20_02165, partial [bacterium (Candidatus Gribaldobacteria) CG08_land_8_20_14_0_20_39_15]